MSAALATLIDRSHREREDWRYTDLEKLLKAAKIAQPISANDSSQDLPSRVSDPTRRQRIVFIDGVWRQDQTQLGDLPSTVLQGDAIKGYRLVFAAQTCLVTAPIELVFVRECADDVAIKLAIEIGANSSLTIVEHYVDKGTGHAAQTVDVDLYLGTQAKLVHGKVMHHMPNVAHFSSAKVIVENGAFYRACQLLKSARILRHEIDVTLAGPLAQCGLYGAMLVRGHEHSDVLTRVHHAAPHTSSQQLYKAVLKDQSRGVFQGKIKVAEGAQKTDGRQLCRALLLSDQAEMDAKPELEIYADDVACSHGCAIGDLDADAMFYLRSRGLSASEARALLLRAFIDEAIDKIPDEQARIYVRDLAERWMHE